MKFFLLPVALAASLAAAQSATSSACAAQNILDTCVAGLKAQFDSCGDNDWDCKCNAYGNIVTCYNNCPNDPEKQTALGQQSIYCGYATQFPSKTTKVAQSTGTASAATAAATTTGSSAAAATGTATTTSTAPAKSNGAADLAMNAGGVLAAVAAVVAAAL